MALPTKTNASVGSVPLKVSAIVPARTAYVTVSPTGVSKTCNLTSDTLIFSADKSVWDDTQGAWISIDLTSHRPTPRTQDSLA